MQITKWYCDTCKKEVVGNDLVTVYVSVRPAYRPVAARGAREINICRECSSKFGFRFKEYGKKLNEMSADEIRNSAEKAMIDQPKVLIEE